MFCATCGTPLPEQSRFCPTCGANLSDPELSTRQRLAVKELFEALKAAVQGRYRVVDMLGRGGMGAVFLAEDLRLDRRVAIKVLLPEVADDPTFVGRFEREARMAARLDHANIIPIYEVEQVEDFHYFVMKYVAGKSLEELLTGQPLPASQARQILWQAARGLGHAHQRGIIHRDVKPSNIMIEEGEGRVIITDFGISKAIQSDSQYTLTGQMLGTPCYLSPEQAQGHPIDARSDQYSLAVVGYQMFVGHLPLIANTSHALLYKHIYEIPLPAQTVRPEVPTEISRALQQALAKKPEQRFPSMAEFATAVWPERPVRGSQPVPSIELDDRSGRPGGSVLVAGAGAADRGLRRRWPALVGALVAILAAAGIGVTVLQGRHGETQLPSGRGEDTVESGAPREPVVTEHADSLTRTDTAVAATPLPPPPDTASLQHEPASPMAPPATETVPKPVPPPAKKRARPSRPPPERTETTATTMRPATPSVGYLTINAVPYGTLSIDGVEVGDTPIVRHELTPGKHTIRIVREGFRTESETVTVTAGNEVRLSRTLVKEAR